MSAVEQVNPNAQRVGRVHALDINISAAKGLMEILRSNLGPRGTMKMLVSGAGDIKITKDGNVLLHEMQIQHPTACMIARAATAQDDITGDGTTSAVLLIGELLKTCQRYIQEGLHPRVLADGLEIAREEALKFLDLFATPLKGESTDLLHSIAKTCLRTKIQADLADSLAPALVEAVNIVRRSEAEEIDLHMVEIMHMEHRMDTETGLVRGLVLDHGGRHPEMPKRLEKCYILTCNVSFEYEKSEVGSGMFYSSAEEREKMVQAERERTLSHVKKVIDLKQKLCGKGPNTEKSFVVINQKGIEPISLEAFAKEGILALRRAKRRNMERLVLSCGGEAVNSVENLDESCLGYAGLVYEHVIGDDKYTFVEEVQKPHSCTLLIKGASRHIIAQVKDAIRDGLRNLKNALEDGKVIAGAGSFELALASYLHRRLEEGVTSGKTKIGVKALAEALHIIPTTLAENSGFDLQETLIELQEALPTLAQVKDSQEFAQSAACKVGLDIDSGKPMDALEAGIFDNYRVKRQIVSSAAVIAAQLLLVDEIMRAGRERKKAAGPGPGGM